jgi:outer membrane protein W
MSPSIRETRTAWRLAVFVAPVVVLAALCATPAASAQQAEGWSVRAAGVYYDPAGDSFVDTFLSDGATGVYTVEDAGTGFGLFVAYRWSPRWSVEAGGLLTEVDNDYAFTLDGQTVLDTDSVEVETYLVGVDWHFAPASRTDWTVGLFVAETSFTDAVFLTEVGRTLERSFDDDHGFGVKLGGAWNLGASGWFAGLDARYLVTMQEGEIGGQDLDLDPLIVSAGVGYRF